MLIIIRKIKDYLSKENISQNQLSRMLNIYHGSFGSMMRGKNPFPKYVIERLSPILEVSKEEIEGWVLADKYPKDIIKQAIEVRKSFPYKRKSILTTNIDKILKEKNMSRTALSKLIKYSQSSLNNMITGKEALSPTVIERIAPVLEVNQDTIISWHVADKYSLRTLEFAFETKPSMD